MNKGSVIACMAIGLLAGGCATPRHSIPLSAGQRQALLRRAASATALGVGIKAVTNAQPTLTGVNQFPLGTRIEAPLQRPAHVGAGSPVARVHVQGRALTALIDTAAPLSVTDHSGFLATGMSAVAPDSDTNGPPGDALFSRTVSSPAGPLHVYAAVADTADVGGTRIYHPSLGVLDERHGFLRCWWLDRSRADFVIGNDFLRAFERVNLNFPRGTVTFASGKYKPQLERMAAALSFIYRDGIPVVASHLNGNGPFPVALWTGSGGGLWISHALAVRMALPGAETPPAARQARQPEGFALGDAALNLGGFEMAAVPVTVGWPREGTELPYALLGNGVLRNYIVTFDYKSKKIYLENP